MQKLLAPSVLDGADWVEIEVKERWCDLVLVAGIGHTGCGTHHSVM